MFRPGEAIVLRALDHRYRPLIGLPATVVEDTPDLVVLHLPLGTRVQWYAGATMGGPRDRAILEWPGAHEERDWIGNELLILKRPDEMHSVQVIWSRLDRRFLGWYVNLEERSRRTARGFDVRDLELDLEIAPDLSWHWKDEDVFEWAISAGRIPSAIAAASDRKVSGRCIAFSSAKLPSTLRGSHGSRIPSGPCRRSQRTGLRHAEPTPRRRSDGDHRPSWLRCPRTSLR